MNKEMFLKELSDRLQVLKEQERQELLEEYAQHIDLKIENGLSEEDAVKDFGTPAELSAELLDVYHIDSEYAANALQEKSDFHVTDKIGKFWKGIAAKGAEYLPKKETAANESKTEENKAEETIIKEVKIKEAKIKEAKEEAEVKDTVAEETASEDFAAEDAKVSEKEGEVSANILIAESAEGSSDKLKEKSFTKKVETEGKRLRFEELKQKLAVWHAEVREKRKVRRTVRKEKLQLYREAYLKRKADRKEYRSQHGGCWLSRLICRLWKLTVRMMGYFWKFCLFCMAVPAVLLGLISLFGTGMVFVLCIKGYPLTGISLFGGGVCLASAGLAGMFLGYVFTGKRAETERKSGHMLIMTGLLLAGVLMGGIGAGYGLVEFSELQYKETVWMGCEETVQKKLVYEIENKNLDQLYCYTGMSLQKETAIEEDRKVPLDEVWFEVTYNPEYCEPVIDCFANYENGEISREEIHIWTQNRGMDEVETFFKIKDQILEDLKNQQIRSWRFAPVAEMTIYVHPQVAEKLIVF